MGNIITSMPTNNSLPYETLLQPLIENIKANALPFGYSLGQVNRDIYLKVPVDADPTVKTTCGWSFAEGNGFTKKTLDPYELDFSWKQCYTPLAKSIYGDQLNDGQRRGDLTSVPELMSIFTTEQLNNANNKMLTAFFLADTALVAYPWLSQRNGIFKKLKIGVAAVDGTVDAGAITDTDLLPANIEATMFKIYNAQSELLMAQADSEKSLLVTGSIARAWKRYLQIGTGLQNGTPDRASIVGGVSELAYNGIPIVDLSFLDGQIKAYNTAGSPPTVTDPHRAILTIGMNHRLILDGTGFEQVDPYYDRNDDHVKSPLSAMLDYVYAIGDLNVIAGF